MTDDELKARVSIQYTMAVYNNSVDKGDVEGVVSAFAETAKLATHSASCTGRDEIHTFYNSVVGTKRAAPNESLPLIRHNLTTSRIEITSATQAQGWTYFLVMSKHGPDHSGQYVDTFGKIGDRWLITDRKIVVEWYATPGWYQSVRLKAKAS